METIKNKAKRLYCEFLIDYGDEPKFALCEIKYKGEIVLFDEFIALSSDSSENDEQVFYFCNSLDDLLSLTEDNVESMEDFIITDIYRFLPNLI